MEIKFTHDTSSSCDVVLSLEDDLDDGKIPQTEHYKVLIKYIPQDFLDNFLGWFGQECIERYTKKKENIEDNNIDVLAEESCRENNFYHGSREDLPTEAYIVGYKAGYRKAMEGIV